MSNLFEKLWITLHKIKMRCYLLQHVRNKKVLIKSVPLIAEVRLEHIYIQHLALLPSALSYASNVK